MPAVWVIAAVVLNLVTELVGGIRVTVLEEEAVLTTLSDDAKN
jgi:hypothetical protein